MYRRVLGGRLPLGHTSMVRSPFSHYFFQPFAASFATRSPPKEEQSSPAKIVSFAERIRSQLKGTPDLKTILKAVWEDSEITSQCPKLIIRLTSLRGQVSQMIWKMVGNDPNDIQILAVGTVVAPELPAFKNFVRNFQERTSQHFLASDNYELGYDLLSKGNEAARRSVLTMFNEHYGFEDTVLNECVSNAAITCGGMRGLKDIADAMVLNAKDLGLPPHRFLQPDNSFGTWWNIIENPVQRDSFRREIGTIGTRGNKKLHLTPEDVDAWYADNAPVPSESWYITPVGNPSGTKITPENLQQSCEKILENNPNATIILDTVYVRTLQTESAKALMKGIVSNNKILHNTIFQESFSKSHGFCGERLGIYFSANPELFTKLHTANIAFSAGPGRIKDCQFKALGEMTPEEKAAVDEVHRFWGTERKGLLNFLLSDKNRHLFAEEQPHITDDDIDNPLGLYILLKTNTNIKAQDVFMETGALGVDTILLSGHYIRFAVGTLTKPTFAKYL